MKFVVPKQGQPHQLVEMAAENASETLAALRAQWQADTHKQEQALAELQAALHLGGPPNRIECYDVSNIQGTAIIGAMVVFEQGVASKRLYRKFNIESVVGAPDDFASMEEMLTRRFRRWQSAQETADQPGAKLDPAFAFLPNLIVIDGGKGQLGRVMNVLEKSGLKGKVPVVGLAKQKEEIFFPDKSEALMLPRHSQALYLVQRIRDEAHRYGITAHRAKRSKLGLTSQLEAIRGIGPARRKALLKHFGSIDGIRGATIEELSGVVSRRAAEAVKSQME